MRDGRIAVIEPIDAELDAEEVVELGDDEVLISGLVGSDLGQQEQYHLEYRQNDNGVRATIVRVIADHLHDHEYSWSARDFDFRTAHLEDVDFVGAVFRGTTRSDDAWFDGATFSGPTSFAGTDFGSGEREIPELAAHAACLTGHPSPVATHSRGDCPHG